MSMGSKTGARPASVVARCVIAIILTVLTIVFLFWPASLYIGTDGASRRGVPLFEMANELAGMENGILGAFVFSVCCYVCLSLAIASVILMSIRKTNVVTIIYAGVTVLMLFGCIAYLIAANSSGNDIEKRPGAGLFLIPLCAAVAALLYPAYGGRPKIVPSPSVPDRMDAAPAAERTVSKPVPQKPKSGSAAGRSMPKSASTPKSGMLISTFKVKPAANPEPAVTREMPVGSESPVDGPTWECPLCGRVNKASELFCPNCNTIRE